MAVKTPVVVTSGHTGKSRTVLHNKTGLVVPMKDISALVRATGSLIENPDFRHQLATNGHEYALKEFNPATNSGKVLQLYNELTNRVASQQSSNLTPVLQ
jgi:glycosyltransferase involved in cell wall biosynthesis